MKILIIRFSSFGDIAQCMGSVKALKELYPHSNIDWVTKSSFESLVKSHPDIDKVFTLHSKGGVFDLLKLGVQLRKEGYNLVYDAHHNLRSSILRFFFVGTKKIVRSKNRWKRFLLFKLRINKFENPFRGMYSYIYPLTKNYDSHPIQLEFEGIDKSKLPENLSEYIILAPSAAWEMKRWPLEYWKALIKSLPNQKFIILGGPEDHFLKDLENERVLNLAGKLSFVESAHVIKNSKGLISADTGALHLADLMGVANLALLGPTAFGRPTHPKSLVIEKELKCRPCTKDGRGKCTSSIYKECMVSLKPEMVAQKALSHFF